MRAGKPVNTCFPAHITDRAAGHPLLLDGARSEASAGAGVSLRAERLLLRASAPNTNSATGPFRPRVEPSRGAEVGLL
jgi:hypothetical protein